MTAKPSPVGTQVGIQRYMGEVDGLIPNDAGGWVRYADHKERVTRLEAALRNVLHAVEEPMKYHPECTIYQREREAALAALTNDAGEGA